MPPEVQTRFTVLVEQPARLEDEALNAAGVVQEALAQVFEQSAVIAEVFVLANVEDERSSSWVPPQIVEEVFQCEGVCMIDPTRSRVLRGPTIVLNAIFRICLSFQEESLRTMRVARKLRIDMRKSGIEHVIQKIPVDLGDELFHLVQFPDNLFFSSRTGDAKVRPPNPHAREFEEPEPYEEGGGGGGGIFVSLI